MKRYYIILLAATILCTASCKRQEKTGEEENKKATDSSSTSNETDTVLFTSEQYKLTDIKLGSLSTRTINSFVKASGYLKLPPQKLADVSVFMGGIVKEISVIEGDKVQKGQVLAVLEHPDYITLQENYLKSKDNLEF